MLQDTHYMLVCQLTLTIKKRCENLEDVIVNPKMEHGPS
jgi:hypothetical protein